jgi:hypothetical protein
MIKDDKRNGFGVQKWATGSKFEGLFKDDLPDSHGVFIWHDGS